MYMYMYRVYMSYSHAAVVPCILIVAVMGSLLPAQ